MRYMQMVDSSSTLYIEDEEEDKITASDEPSTSNASEATRRRTSFSNNTKIVFSHNQRSATSQAERPPLPALNSSVSCQNLLSAVNSQHQLYTQILDDARLSQDQQSSYTCKMPSIQSSRSRSSL